MLNPIFNQCRD